VIVLIAKQFGRQEWLKQGRLKEMMVHELFGIKDKRAAELYVRMAEFIMSKTPEKEIANRISDKKELAFVMYMLGWYGGAFSHLKNRYYPELEFIGKVIIKIKREGREGAIDFVENRIRTVKSLEEIEERKNVI